MTRYQASISAERSKCLTLPERARTHTLTTGQPARVKPVSFNKKARRWDRAGKRKKPRGSASGYPRESLSLSRVSCYSVCGAGEQKDHANVQPSPPFFFYHFSRSSLLRRPHLSVRIFRKCACETNRGRIIAAVSADTACASQFIGWLDLWIVDRKISPIYTNAIASSTRAVFYM